MNDIGLSVSGGWVLVPLVTKMVCRSNGENVQHLSGCGIAGVNHSYVTALDKLFIQLYVVPLKFTPCGTLYKRVKFQFLFKWSSPEPEKTAPGGPMTFSQRRCCHADIVKAPKARLVVLKPSVVLVG